MVSCFVIEIQVNEKIDEAERGDRRLKNNTAVSRQPQVIYLNCENNGMEQLIPRFNGITKNPLEFTRDLGAYVNQLQIQRITE